MCDGAIRAQLRANALPSTLPTWLRVGLAIARRADAAYYGTTWSGDGPSSMDLMLDAEYGWP
jgi:hypothetical protein